MRRLVYTGWSKTCTERVGAYRWSYLKIQVIWKLFAKYLDLALRGRIYTRILRKSAFFDKFFDMLSFFTLKLPLFGKNIYFIMKCIHSSFEYGLFLCDHASLSTNHIKRERSRWKNLYFSCKMTLFFLSLFFLKYLCRSTPRDLDQAIRQIIFKLVVFYDMTIG